ncbi:MAG: ACR3 family arsenite efflux transporter [Thermoplasmata archaeon]|jgi:ACR3 family arsenite transporter
MTAESWTVRSAPARLSFLDRYLTLWIFGAMLGGLAFGRFEPSVVGAIGAWMVPGTPVPLAVGVGLVLMMYPPLARVRYEELGKVFRSGRLLLLSLVQNWIVGPFLMFGLAIVFLRNSPDLLVGLVLIGSARCIAMVLVWNELAGGNREYAAGLVAFNSLFQVVFYGAYIYLFVTILLPLAGLPSLTVPISWELVVLSVLVFLGVPFAAGVITRWGFIRSGRAIEYDQRIAPALAPVALVALLYTIVVMFAFQSDAILQLPGEVLLVAAPLVLYFAIMFFASFYMSRRAGADYGRTAALSLTAASNNFELAITVAVAVFGIASAEALAATVGPLVEVPVLLGLVRASIWLGRRYFPPPAAAPGSLTIGMGSTALAQGGGTGPPPARPS